LIAARGQLNQSTAAERRVVQSEKQEVAREVENRPVTN
jgi:hypothetical protein